MAVNCLAVLNSVGSLSKAELEVLGKSCELCENVYVLVIGEMTEKLESALNYGSLKKVFYCESLTDKCFSSHRLAQYVFNVFQRIDVSLVLTASNELSRSWLPLMGVRAGGNSFNDCTSVELHEDKVLIERFEMSSKCLSSYMISKLPAVLSLRPGCFEFSPGNSLHCFEVEEVSFPDSASLEIQALNANDENENLEDADIIVIAGRGVKDATGFKMIKEFAASLHASLGVTRAVVEMGLAPASLQVGQTGKTVSPSVCILCGVSGAVQHTAGIIGSRCIMAVNKDSDAPIYSICDYGFVGDLFELIPLLKEKIQKSDFQGGDL